MGSDEEGRPKETSAASKCPDMSLDVPRLASVQDKSECGCETPEEGE